MDFHSHLAHTEIIGLLGGYFDETANVLRVQLAFPCRSVSTGIQCEMDPVSECQACELFDRKNLKMVGWYHSHPTFEPNPSVRDIENQGTYQDLCRMANGVELFIGAIVSPYDLHNPTNISKFNFIHIGNEVNQRYNIRK